MCGRISALQCRFFFLRFVRAKLVAFQKKWSVHVDENAINLSVLNAM